MWKRVLHLVWALYFVYIVVEVTMNNWTWLNILVVGSQRAGGLRPSVKCVSYIYVWFNCKRKMVGNKISRNLCHWGARCLLGKCLLNFHFVFLNPSLTSQPWEQVAPASLFPPFFPPWPPPPDPPCCTKLSQSIVRWWSKKPWPRGF